MRLIMAVMGSNDSTNFFKLLEVDNQLGSKDTILVSGNAKQCVDARAILGNLGIEQNRILLDIKDKGTRNFVKEYMNDYRNLTFIIEEGDKLAERLIRNMYTGRLTLAKI